MKILVAALLGFALADAAKAEALPLLTREEAVARALADDPAMKGAAESVAAAESLARQAGLRPNPSIDLQLENFAGSAPFGEVGRAEATYALSQQFELGGDRHARRTLAESEAGAARIRADLGALDVREAVEIAFAEAQAAEAVLAIAASRLEVAKKFARAVDERVKAARDPLAARARVQARLAEAEIDLEGAKARAKAARAALASYWDGSETAIEMATFFKPESRGRDEEALPDLALAEAQQKSASARIAIERAKRVPDPDVRAGFRQLRETDSSAFVVGVNVPLPFWNRNSGAIAAARAESARAGYEVEARSRTLAREIAILIAQAETSSAEIEAYAARVIPSGEEALSRSLDGYAQGGLSYIEVLDAQQSLADARLRQVSALLAFHRAEARLARRRGVLSPVNGQENQQ